MTHAVASRTFVILFAIIAASAAGCGAKKPRIPVVSSGNLAKFSIQASVSETANQNSPIPVDFVMVSDKKLMPEVAKLSAKDWFDRRVQILRDFPKKVEVVSWELVPGQRVGPISVAVASGTRGAFLFANYLNGGGHRAYVDVRAPVTVNFGPEDFSVQSLK
jgi:type VI secretion system protein